MARRTRRRSWRSLVKRLGVKAAARAYRGTSRKSSTRRRRSFRRNVWFDHSRLHARAAKKGWRRRRGYRRNPGTRRHYRRSRGFRFNVGGLDVMSPVNELMRADTYLGAAQYVGGALAALAFPRVVNMVVTVADAGFAGYAMNLGGAVAGSIVAGFVDKRLATKVFVGGLVVTALRAALDFVGPTLGIRPLSGMSAATQRLEREIASEVRKALGVSDFPIRADTLPLSDFPTRTESLPMGDYPTMRLRGFPTHQMGEDDSVIPVDEAS